VVFLKLQTILIQKREEVRVGKQKRGAKLLKKENLMATKNILFFIKIPEKGKKLSTPRMLKRYHREPSLSM
jgi:hypothetical protein